MNYLKNISLYARTLKVSQAFIDAQKLMDA